MTPEEKKRRLLLAEQVAGFSPSLGYWIACEAAATRNEARAQPWATTIQARASRPRALSLRSSVTSAGLKPCTSWQSTADPPSPRAALTAPRIT